MDIDNFVEQACRAWYDSGLLPGQYGWDKLVTLNDHRLKTWRDQMRTALDAVGFFDLVVHHKSHHPTEAI